MLPASQVPGDQTKVPRLARARRVALGLAAICGLVTAGCVSGLPAATCEAIAETYMRAIVKLGTIGFVALIIVVVFEFMDEDDWLGYVFVALLGAIFFLSANAALFNLRIATGFCLFGSEDQVKDRAHQQAPLLNWYDVRKMINLIRHSPYDSGIERL